MKKILIIDTTWPINSRTERFRKTLSKEYELIVSAWKRNKNVEIFEKNTYIMESNIGYGNQILKLIKLPLFFFHNLKVYRKIKPEIIFASHWDSLLCAVLVRIFSIRKPQIIYDCLDVPTSSTPFIRKTLQYIEKFSLNFTNITIFASRYFADIYQANIKSIVFENYPSASTLKPTEKIPEWFNGYDLNAIKSMKSVSWVGVVRYIEILEKILNSIEETDISFFVFGTGPDLEKLEKLVAKKNLQDKVYFFGKYTQSDISFIYEISRLIWAAYPTNDFNAIYAISNKYFECSFYEKPPIISRKTRMASHLKNNRSAILINEYDDNEIKAIIKNYFGKETPKFEKYEPNITWEEKEQYLIDYMKSNLN